MTDNRLIVEIAESVIANGALKTVAVVGIGSSLGVDRRFSDGFRWSADSRVGHQLDLGCDYSNVRDLAAAVGAVDSTCSGANAIGDGRSHRRTGGHIYDFYNFPW